MTESVRVTRTKEGRKNILRRLMQYSPDALALSMKAAFGAAK